MHQPIQLDRESLPGRLTVAEFERLIDLLRAQGFNIKVGKTDQTDTWGARLHEYNQYRALENAIWYTITDITWDRAAARLVAAGYTRHDDGPVPTFSKDDLETVYLARRLGGWDWFRMPTAKKEEKALWR